MLGMLSVRMNDLAAEALDVASGWPGVVPPGGLAEGLRERAARGLACHGDVLIWAGTQTQQFPDHSHFPDLTGWECFANSFHLDGPVPVPQPLSEEEMDLEPDREGQVLLLRQGFAFALEVAQLVRALDPPVPVRCLVSVSGVQGTFRFHVIRDGESWHAPDLDSYRDEMLLVVDAEPH
jgi:hypothetical protein